MPPQLPPTQNCEPAHSFCGSAHSMGLHMPGPPVVSEPEHDLQSPVHEVLQHTPSTQKVLVHSDEAPHGAPSDSSTHAPTPLQ
jgi:hypothetical protein